MTRIEELRLLILGSKTDTSKDDIIGIMVNMATEKCLNLLYPYHEDRTGLTVPTMYTNWVTRCAKELYQMLGVEGLISYSENQLSWTKATDGISKDLILEVLPYAYTPLDAVEE